MIKFVRILPLSCLLLTITAHAANPAGDVLLAVGQVWVESGGKRLELGRGQAVYEGQKIITRDGGHIHIRMKDGSLLAVRPNSILDIEVYQYNPASPANGKIRYKLREGVARSVTGAIGESNKQNFRLNTPLAAIGIRGTDFVTFASNDTTRVSVSTGAIVVAPFGEGCQIEAFGACLDRSLLVKGDGGNSYAEITRQNQMPRLLQDNLPLSTPDKTAPAHPAEPAALLQEGNSTLSRLSDASKPDLPKPDYGVHWGRWNNGTAGLAGKTVTELLAAKQPIHLSNSLFGLGVSSTPARLPDNWQAQFQLAGGEAYAISAGVATAATLGSGNLQIDLARQRFNANFSVSEGGNTHQLAASGNADWRGYFSSREGSTSLTGVVNGNLGSAGSLFENQLNDGRILAGSLIWAR